MVSRWSKCAVSIQPLMFAIVCVGGARTASQNVEPVCYGGEFILIVTFIVIVLIIAGEIPDSNASIQVVARLDNVVYQVNADNRRGFFLGAGNARVRDECYGQEARQQCDQNGNRFSVTHPPLPYYVPHGVLSCHC